MRNYMARLGLNRRAPQKEIRQAIADAMAGTGELHIIRDADSVLSVTVTRAYYERVHLQFDAIHAALPCLGRPGSVDTHHWMDRVVEFATEPPEHPQRGRRQDGPTRQTE
ncbi:MAG: hypothetical protein HKN42_10580 [Granulosicoccus sp.]|nr:hypothetical protein [Granulosicoccus sp.]